MQNKRMLPKTKKAMPKKSLNPVQIAQFHVDQALYAMYKTYLLFPEKELGIKLLALSAAKAPGAKPAAPPKIISRVRAFLAWEKSLRAKIQIARDSCLKAGITMEAASLVAMFDKVDAGIRTLENLLPPEKSSAKKPARRIPK